MAAKTINKILLIFGFLSLIHAAFSAAHHRAYLRLTEQEWNQLPADIILQTVLSLLIIIYNIIEIVGNFKEIRATVDMQGKSWDTLGNLPSFYIFNHRGKALSANYELPESSTRKSSLNADI